MFCTKADISWNTHSSSLLSRSGLVDHGVDHSLDPSVTIFQPCFWLRKRLECDTCTFDWVSFVWLTLAIAIIPFSWVFFCHVEHCQLTACSVWHEGLPDHFSPCQNTWAPHYAAARDWLKSKGVSALTDRSGVVCCLNIETSQKLYCHGWFPVLLLSVWGHFLKRPSSAAYLDDGLTFAPHGSDKGLRESCGMFCHSWTIAWRRSCTVCGGCGRYVVDISTCPRHVQLALLNPWHFPCRQ